jgi:hypothetical protein
VVHGAGNGVGLFTAYVGFVVRRQDVIVCSLDGI